MIGYLRFFGILVAAVWLGAALLFPLLIGPAFGAPDLQRYLGQKYGGLTELLIWERYFLVLYWCGIFAVIHLLAEKIYTSKPVPRISLYLILSLLLLTWISDYWLLANMQHHYFISYAPRVSAAQVENARKAYGIWSAIFTFSNLLLLGGVIGHLWKIVNPTEAPRFVPRSKFM